MVVNPRRESQSPKPNMPGNVPQGWQHAQGSVIGFANLRSGKSPQSIICSGNDAGTYRPKRGFEIDAIFAPKNLKKDFPYA